MLSSQVLQFDLTKQTLKKILFIQDDYVSGLGFLPNENQLLYVSMKKRKIFLHDLVKNTTKDYADVCSLTNFRANDLVVDVTGRAYVGNFGFDFTSVMDAKTTTIVQIDTDQSIHLGSKGLFFPNGSVITPDGKTLIIAETFAGLLTAFDIDRNNGHLSNRRVWADIGVPIDGICLDAKGFVWAAIPQVGIYETCGGLIRVEEGGKIHDIIGFGQNEIKNGVFACILGTNQVDQKHYLYFMEAKTADEKKIFKKGLEFAKQNGFLKAIEVQIGPAIHSTYRHYCAGYC
jgi:sugar lactone lactonase YvrE